MLMRINGTNRLDCFGNEMDQLFEGLFGRGASQVHPAGPALNIREDDVNFYVEAELPGLRPEDVEITVTGDELVIQGERTTEHEETETWHRRERTTGAFRRVLRLGTDIDANKVEAVAKDGVWTLTLPKVEAARSRKIKVQDASN